VDEPWRVDVYKFLQKGLESKHTLRGGHKMVFCLGKCEYVSSVGVFGPLRRQGDET